jgi:DNA gyrase subunit B
LAGWLADVAGCRATFDPDTIRSRLRELAFLNSRASIFFRALDGKKAPASSSNGSSSGSNGSGAPAAAAAAAGPVREGWEIFHYSGGLAEYVRYLNRDKEPIHEPFYFSKTVSDG